MIFSPVQSDAATDDNSIKIELVIEKKQAATETQIKRTAVEEENYVASSWMRPPDLPLNLGPRCLRVLPPLADMLVTNITESSTNGKALEGTINRVLLRLKAGDQEDCSDVAVRFSCSSFLVSASGDSTKISSEPIEGEETMSVVDPLNPHVRTPVLVKTDKDVPAKMTKYGYEIPKGWTLVGEDGHGEAEDMFVPVIETLKSDEQTYAVFAIFRPSPPVTRIAGVFKTGEDEEGLAYEHSMCQSDIEVSIRYRQSRSLQTKKTVTTKRRGRRKTEDEPLDPPPSDENESDLVFLTETVPIVWSQPISTTFSPGVKSTHPCGNRHPTNVVPDSNTRRNPIGSTVEAEMVLVDGERVTTRCTLEAAASADGLLTDVQEIKFQVR
jgi:hypothetical protein